MKTREASVKSSCIHPQSEQVLDEGYQRDTNLTCTEASRALYSICRLNSYMPTSTIARLRRRFLSIPETCKSSSTMTAGRSLSGLVLATIAEVALCRASLRTLAIRACILANLVLAFLRFREPFCLRECRRDVRFSLFSFFLRALGLANVHPSEQVANVLIPRSTPMTSPVACGGSACCSCTQMETYHLPAFSLIVALPILTFIGR